MADTVIDDVPETVDEPRKKKESPWRWVLYGGIFLALVAGGLAFYVYWFMWRDTWTAHLHVPAGANIVVRTDGKQLFLFKPFREHVLAALSAEREKEPDTPARKLMRRVEKETGVDFGADLRDVIAASVDGLNWVVVLGGKFSRSGVVDGVEKALKAEGISGYSRDGELLSFGKGMTVAQADDGTLIVATSASLAAAALPASEGTRVPIPVRDAMSFLVNERALSGITQFIPSQIANAFLTIAQATGSLSLGDSPRSEIVLEPKAGTDAEAVKKDVEFALSAARFGFLLYSPPYGVKDAVNATTVAVQNGRVVLTAPWPYAGLEDACKALGASVSSGGLDFLLPRPGAPAPSATP